MYDIVIIDGTSSILVADSIALSSMVDSTILVAENRKTKINDLKKVKKLIEDDTDAATSLKLELKNARAITGTVFVDSTEKESDKIYTNQERKGNGIFDNGEKTLEGIEVKLRDTETGNTTQIYDENSKKFVEATTKTDANGNFEFVGFIPGDYVVVYIWGDKEYKVQYYKGTIYDESRDQSNV